MKEIGKHWNNTLQALAYWIAYKKQYYSNSLLPEGAIVGELTQLLSANISVNEKVECEKMYKDINSSVRSTIRADIVIKNNPKGTPYAVVAGLPDFFEAIEVKRYEPGFKHITADIEKLHQLKSVQKNIRAYLVVVSQGVKPKELFTNSFNVRKSNVYAGEDKIEAKVRIGRKAYGNKKESETGAYAALIEIL